MPSSFQIPDMAAALIDRLFPAITHLNRLEGRPRTRKFDHALKAEVRDALYELDSGPGPMRLTGFVADPKCDRGNAKLQYLFVNGRWFRDRSLAHALQESFRGLLISGRYAIGFLYLTIPPDKVDVNVHPTKA